MKTMRWPAVLLAGASLATAMARPQDKPRPESKPATPLKVQVVFTEFEGEKKISSMPYILYATTDDREASLRMGLRVPIFVNVSTKDASSNFQYMDVGTDVDCSAQAGDDGRFKLILVVRRSSIYSAGAEKKALDWSPGDEPLRSQPIVRQFNARVVFFVRDAQTVQSTLATDPVSGRVVKVDVTAWTAK